MTVSYSFATVADLVASDLSYTSDPNSSEVTSGDRVVAQGFSYSVLNESSSDFDLKTTGDVVLRVIGSTLNSLAFGVVADGVTDDDLAFFRLRDRALTLANSGPPFSNLKIILEGPEAIKLSTEQYWDWPSDVTFYLIPRVGILSTGVGKNASVWRFDDVQAPTKSAIKYVIDPPLKIQYDDDFSDHGRGLVIPQVKTDSLIQCDISGPGGPQIYCQTVDNARFNLQLSGGGNDIQPLVKDFSGSDSAYGSGGPITFDTAGAVDLEGKNLVAYTASRENFQKESWTDFDENQMTLSKGSVVFPSGRDAFRFLAQSGSASHNFFTNVTGVEREYPITVTVFAKYIGAGNTTPNPKIYLRIQRVDDGDKETIVFYDFSQSSSSALAVHTQENDAELHQFDVIDMGNGIYCLTATLTFTPVDPQVPVPPGGVKIRMGGWAGASNSPVFAYDGENQDQFEFSDIRLEVSDANSAGETHAIKKSAFSNLDGHYLAIANGSWNGQPHWAKIIPDTGEGASCTLDASLTGNVEPNDSRISFGPVRGSISQASNKELTLNVTNPDFPTSDDEGRDIWFRATKSTGNEKGTIWHHDFIIAVSGDTITLRNGLLDGYEVDDEAIIMNWQFVVSRPTKPNPLDPIKLGVSNYFVVEDGSRFENTAGGGLLLEACQSAVIGSAKIHPLNFNKVNFGRGAVHLAINSGDVTLSEGFSCEQGYSIDGAYIDAVGFNTFVNIGGRYAINSPDFPILNWKAAPDVTNGDRAAAKWRVAETSKDSGPFARVGEFANRRNIYTESNPNCRGEDMIARCKSAYPEPMFAPGLAGRFPIFSLNAGELIALDLFYEWTRIYVRTLIASSNVAATREMYGFYNVFLSRNVPAGNDSGNGKLIDTVSQGSNIVFEKRNKNSSDINNTSDLSIDNKLTLLLTNDSKLVLGSRDLNVTDIIVETTAL